VQAEYIGVRNISGKDYLLTQDGNHLLFAKDEVKILENHAGQFALLRSVAHRDASSNVMGKLAIFEQVPLAEALKFAKEPENPSLAAAKEQADQDKARREEIRKEVLEAIKAEGWEAPAGKKSK